MLTPKIRTGLVFSLILAFLVMIAIALYGDAPRMATALAHFRWSFLPLILGLTLYNYGWRFIKWQYYLRRLELRLPWQRSLLIFLSGLSMAITPGKVGELLKAYQLKWTLGTPISRTTPIIVAERLTDGIALVGLAATGLILYRFGWELLLLVLILCLISVVVVQNRQLVLTCLSYGERLAILSRMIGTIRSFYESSYLLLQWRPLLLAVSIGGISWSGECGALYFVYNGLGITPGPDLFIKAMFILSVSSLVGSASGLPGGLGTADGSMLALSRLLLSTSATLGGAAVLLIRLCTLWFGLLIGVSAVVFFRMTQGAHLSLMEPPGWDTHNDRKNILLPTSEQVASKDTPSASAHTGEKVV